MIGNARGRSSSPVEVKKENAPGFKSEDFPIAPKDEFKTKSPLESESEPLIAA